jgi:ribonucleotide monophosphatase NagD (HAD superfamily)
VIDRSPPRTEHGAPSAVEPEPIAIRALLDRFDGLLIDAYGVLVDATGLLPNARELLAELARRRIPYAIVTNDASRSRETYARRFAAAGVDVAPERIVTSGSLLADWFRARGLAGARTCVLGPEDSFDYVRAAGGVPVPPSAGVALDALAVCDDDGYDFLSGIEHALSAVVRAVDAGRDVPLALPNPDLVYPKRDGELGLTSGAVALVVEAVLARRFPARRLVFDRLGKPAPDLFARAARELAIAPARLVMIGDQLETDVAGANAAGIATALLDGVSRWADARTTATVAPTFVLPTIAP